MSDEEKVVEEKAASEEAEARAKDNGKSVDELTELLHQTRSEAKQRRLKERELEEKIAKMEDAQKALDEAKLLEEGKLKELLDAKGIELNELRSKALALETVAEESIKFKAAQVAKYKVRMGSKWNDDYEILPLTALDTLVENAVPKKVGTDNGADAEHSGVELSPDQKKDAYAKYPHISKEKAEEYHKHNLIKVGIIKEK